MRSIGDIEKIGSYESFSLSIINDSVSINLLCLVFYFILMDFLVYF